MELDTIIEEMTQKLEKKKKRKKNKFKK